MTGKSRERISVIVPTLDEEGSLERCLSSARSDAEVELIVADGGSSDGTVSMARRLGAHVVEGAQGRAGQLNAGAGKARGTIVLFLHADTELPRGFGDEVREILSDPSVGLGAFRHRYDSDGRWHRFISLTVNLRCRLLGLPYGDQAFFLRREVFTRLGGFAHLPVLEDLDLVRRARREGGFVMARSEVVTSSRRGRSQGELRTTCANDVLLMGFLLHVPPRRLLGAYRRIAGASRSSRSPSESRVISLHLGDRAEARSSE
jgi:rSAM/selenodomain-associated transferase 2